MDASVYAVRPGSDVGRHARLLAQVHDAHLAGTPSPSVPRQLVARSWRRVQAQGVDPDQASPPEPLHQSDVVRRRTTSLIAGVLPVLRSSLTSIADDARHLMVITDAEGVVLWREGSARVRMLADNLGFTEGANWSEGFVGTNAIGTALAEQSPVQLFAAEHFVRTHHRWTCTACPMRDPRSGDLLGVVDVSGPADTVHPTTVALVNTAVRLAEAHLWRSHQAKVDALRSLAAPILARLDGPGLVVDEHGWVAASAGIAPLDRVIAPQAERPVFVHRVGLCDPEPIPGGWLLRPAAQHKTDAIWLALDLESTPPRAHVHGTNHWIHPLSNRHAEVLLLLARHRSGLDTAALSRALYGHTDHLVTVRAEVSRLRRTLGGLLLARPYRLAPAVHVQLPDLTRSAFVRASTSPGVRALSDD